MKDILKQELLKMLNYRSGDLNITEIPCLIPDSRGQESMYLAVADKVKSDILVLKGVSIELVEVITELRDANLIQLRPETHINYLFDGSPQYSLPIYNYKKIKKNVKYWQPTTIRLLGDLSKEPHKWGVNNEKYLHLIK